MADAPHDAARGERLAALGAVALLAAATALAFGRVFAGPEPTARLVAAAVASVAVAGLAERRPLLVAALVSAAGLAIAVAALVFPRTAFLWVLPTEATLDAVGRALRVVGEQARVQVAPTPPLPALVLAAVTAVWTAAFSIHALAIRAGSPILAALPPVGLLGFADSVLLDGARPGYAALFLGALLAVTFLDGLRRVRRWGPIVARPGRRWLTGTTTTGARRVAAAALGVAILTPGILPGFRSGPLLDITTIADDETVGIDPFVSIRESLRRDDPVELFRIRADRPAYWRMLGLERFDGESWRTGDLDLSEALPYQAGEPLEGRLSGVDLLRQEVEVRRDLAFPWVPVAFPAYTIDLGSAFRYDPNLGTAAGPEHLSAGMRYVATSQPQAPTPEQLARVQFQPPFRYGVYTELPADTPQAIYDIARRWTEGRPTAFERILAIQDRLRTFRYDETVPARADSFTLVDFLTRTKRGFCQQFASAMAVLVRALGYPARVAVGFAPGTLDEATGTYSVTTDEAHSWVEVLFPGYGWLAFEPTPRRENPIAEPYLAPPATGCQAGSPGCPAGAETEAREAGAGLDGNLSRQLTAHDRELADQGARRRGAGGGIEPPPGGVPLRPIGAGLAALALLALILVPPVRAARRRLHLARSREPRALVLACYDVFSSRAADLGMGRREGETVEEHRRRLAEAARADGDLETLARMVHAAAYGPGPVAPEEASEARRAARGAVRDLAGRVGLARRIAGAYRPGW